MNLTKQRVKKLGQYFTTNNILKEKLYEFILNDPLNILEPSIGQGDLVDYVLSKNDKIIFDMYEIDESINLLQTIKKEDVIYGDFMKIDIGKKYKTIIGNPPYVKTKTGNLYVDFIKKCYDLLDDNGELIFIIPSDFLKLTHASNFLNIMMINGTFTHIYHPNNEKMFKNASIDVMIFRYCNDKLLEKKTLLNNISLHIVNSNGLITFENETHKNKILFSEYFDVFVGIVSGKEKVYKNEELGNITVLNDENKMNKYILITSYPCENVKINEYLLSHKKELIERKIKKFNDKNWFEWGALRNIETIKNSLNMDCIYINNITRKSKVSFVGKINYFGGNLIMLKPKKTCDLNKICTFINSNKFKNNFMFSGRFKIGHRQICNSYMPEEYL
jgi:adenine-specific DNA-methyltransferase